MSDIFSEEMEKAIIDLFNKRFKQLKIAEIFDTHEDVLKGIEKTIKNVKSDVEENHDEIRDLQDEIENYVKQTDLEELVGRSMLKLVPSFNLRIAKEVKFHLVAIAGLMQETFKEKD